MIKDIHSFLVYPGKNLDEQPKLRGIRINKTQSELYGMLNGIYQSADTECKIEISFEADNQKNEARDDVLAYMTKRTVPRAKKVAMRLQEVTTNRSGLGLLFLMAGKSKNVHKLVIARFPVEQGIIADEKGGTLKVEFIERIFMKNTHSYKSSVYTDVSLKDGFWDGRVVDKQIDSKDVHASKYWINEFLQSDFKTTSVQGTARFASYLRAAANKATSPMVKSALISASNLAGSMNGRTVSIEGLCSQFNLPDEGVELIRKEARNSGVLTERFRFSTEEYRRHIQYHYWETEKGVTVMALEENWRENLTVERTQGLDGDKVRIVTEGKLVRETLRKGKQ